MIPETFHFLRPPWLWALVPVAGLVVLAACSGRRQSPWRRIVDQHLLRHLMVAGAGSGQRWSLGALAAGWVLATVALAGPTWERLPRPTYDSTEATVIALDLSRSMASTDVPPSRLARARFKLHDALDRLTGAQVGLVVYAEDAYVVSPLTDDTDVIREMIPILEHSLVPGRGSRPDRAIDEARALLDQAEVPAGHVVLITGGPGDDADVTRDAAERIAENGHRLSVLGIGDVDTSSTSAMGMPAAARFDTDALQSLARAGSGRFATLSAGSTDVTQILDDGRAGVDRLVATDLHKSDTTADVWRDAGVWLVAALLPMAALAFRRGLVAVFLLTVLLHWDAGAAEAAAWRDLWERPDQQAARARAEGHPAEAAELFGEPGWKAAARYESGEFKDAVTSYRDLPGVENQYNLGNALARSGDLDDAIAAYDDVLDDREGHEDARFNRDLVQQLLDQQREQEQQQQDQQQDQQGDGDGAKDQQSQDSTGDNETAEGGEGAGEEQQQQAGGQSADGEHEDQNESAASEGTDQTESAAQDESATGTDQREAQRDEQSGSSDADDAAAGEHADSGTAGGHSEAEAEAGAEAPSLADRMRDAMDSLMNEPAEEDAPEAQEQSAPSRTAERPMTEDDQRREQVLRRIPDDPGGLLREKIRRRYLERRFAREKGATSW